MNRSLAALFLTIAFLAGIAETSRAEEADSGQAAELWRRMTTIDVNAAYRLLKENHPGAVIEARDPTFRNALETAHAKALQRAKKVRDLGGYIATLGAFGAAMGDGHVGDFPTAPIAQIHWAGFVPLKRGSQWVAVSVDPSIAPEINEGARIVSCDGRPFDNVARDAVGFVTDVDEASLVTVGAWTLSDSENPFLTRPKSCVFDQNGKRTTALLHWVEISRSRFITAVLKKPGWGAAGYGVRQSGNGYWIGLQSLDGSAHAEAIQATIAAVAAKRTDVRMAPYVVVDLRGNLGGDDGFARALAVALYGSERVVAVLGPDLGEAGGCVSVFRATPANIKGIRHAADELTRGGDTRAARNYLDGVARMKSAIAEKRAFAGSLECRGHSRSTGGALGPSLMHGKVYVLTDAKCFSSCINAVGFFRALSAVQIGQATGADTHYSEFRPVTLPSGLSQFGTLSAIVPEFPLRVGPYAPDVVYDGDIADTATLESWVATLASAQP